MRLVSDVEDFCDDRLELESGSDTAFPLRSCPGLLGVAAVVVGAMQVAVPTVGVPAEGCRKRGVSEAFPSVARDDTAPWRFVADRETLGVVVETFGADALDLARVLFGAFPSPSPDTASLARSEDVPTRSPELGDPFASSGALFAADARRVALRAW
jgi:hypothetical protein